LAWKLGVHLLQNVHIGPEQQQLVNLNGIACAAACVLQGTNIVSSVVISRVVASVAQAQ
jgi:hypothetical protein